MAIEQRTRLDVGPLDELPALRAGGMGLALFGALGIAGRYDAAVAPATAVTLLAVLAMAGRLSRGYALALAVTAWASLTGFVVNELGELTFHAPDLVRLALLVGVGLAVAGRRRGAADEVRHTPTRDRVLVGS